jgi:hypothetical protein
MAGCGGFRAPSPSEDELAERYLGGGTSRDSRRRSVSSDDGQPPPPDGAAQKASAEEQKRQLVRLVSLMESRFVLVCSNPHTAVAVVIRLSIGHNVMVGTAG